MTYWHGGPLIRGDIVQPPSRVEAEHARQLVGAFLERNVNQ